MTRTEFRAMQRAQRAIWRIVDRLIRHAKDTKDPAVRRACELAAENLDSEARILVELLERPR